MKKNQTYDLKDIMEAVKSEELDDDFCLYAKEDLEERNETYQIEEVEPDYFMIGQEGDLAYFIKKNADDCIYENDLGALGTLEMQKVAANVYDFIDKILEEGV